jgi:hypothetical protein
METGGIPESASVSLPAEAQPMSTRRTPELRTPFDPAKAMRDRNNAERSVEPVTVAQRMAKRTWIRPEKRPLLRDKD